MFEEELYNRLKAQGIETRSFEDFKAHLADQNNRQDYYLAIRNKDEFDDIVPRFFDEFNSKFSVEKKNPTSQNPVPGGTGIPPVKSSSGLNFNLGGGNPPTKKTFFQTNPVGTLPQAGEKIIVKPAPVVAPVTPAPKQPEGEPFVYRSPLADLPDGGGSLIKPNLGGFSDNNTKPVKPDFEKKARLDDKIAEQKEKIKDVKIPEAIKQGGKYHLTGEPVNNIDEFALGAAFVNGDGIDLPGYTFSTTDETGLRGLTGQGRDPIPTNIISEDTYRGYLRGQGFFPAAIETEIGRLKDVYLKQSAAQLEGAEMAKYAGNVGRFDRDMYTEGLMQLSPDEQRLANLYKEYLKDPSKKAEMDQLRLEVLNNPKTLYDPNNGFIQKDIADEQTVKSNNEVQKLTQIYMGYDKSDRGQLEARRNRLYFEIKQIENNIKQLEGNPDLLRKLPGSQGGNMFSETDTSKIDNLYSLLETKRLHYTAINRALLLNEDPAGTPHQGVLAGAGESVAELFGDKNTIKSDMDFRQNYVAAMQADGAYISKAQEDNVANTVGEDIGASVGPMLKVMGEIALSEMTLGTGVGFLLNDSKLAKATYNLLTSKYGKGGKFAYEFGKAAVRGAVTYAPTDESAGTGLGEGAAQGAFDLLNLDKFWNTVAKKNPLLAKLGEFGSRVAFGTTGEVTQEFAGDYINTLVESGFDVNKAFETAFGKDLTEFKHKLAVIAITSAGMSGAYNSSVLWKVREQLEKDKGDPIVDKGIDIIDDTLKNPPKQEATPTQQQKGKPAKTGETKTPEVQNSQADQGPGVVQENVQADVQNGGATYGLLNEKQVGELEKEIESKYKTSGTEAVGPLKDDIRQDINNYDSPIAQKTVNGSDIRITGGLVRDGQKTYLLYKDGKIAGQFLSVEDAKSAIEKPEINFQGLDQNVDAQRRKIQEVKSEAESKFAKDTEAAKNTITDKVGATAVDSTSQEAADFFGVFRNIFGELFPAHEASFSANGKAIVNTDKISPIVRIKDVLVPIFKQFVAHIDATQNDKLKTAKDGMYRIIAGAGIIEKIDDEIAARGNKISKNDVIDKLITELLPLKSAKVVEILGLDKEGKKDYNRFRKEFNEYIAHNYTDNTDGLIYEKPITRVTDKTQLPTEQQNQFKAIMGRDMTEEEDYAFAALDGQITDEELVSSMGINTVDPAEIKTRAEGIKNAAVDAHDKFNAAKNREKNKLKEVAREYQDVFGLSKEKAKAAAVVNTKIMEEMARRSGQTVEQIRDSIQYQATTIDDLVATYPGLKDVLFQIIGRRGAANIPDLLDMYNVALDLEKKGIPQDEIWKLTGWQKVNEDWQLELDYLTPKEGAEFKEGSTIGDMYDGKILQAYPFLKNVEIKSTVLPGGALGRVAIAAETGTALVSSKLPKFIEISDKIEPGSAKFYSIMIHEVQHIIQSYEGFGLGAHPGQSNLIDFNIHDRANILRAEMEQLGLTDQGNLTKLINDEITDYQSSKTEDTLSNDVSEKYFGVMGDTVIDLFKNINRELEKVNPLGKPHVAQIARRIMEAQNDIEQVAIIDAQLRPFGLKYADMIQYAHSDVLSALVVLIGATDTQSLYETSSGELQAQAAQKRAMMFKEERAVRALDTMSNVAPGLVHVLRGPYMLDRGIELQKVGDSRYTSEYGSVSINEDRELEFDLKDHPNTVEFVVTALDNLIKSGKNFKFPKYIDKTTWNVLQKMADHGIINKVAEQELGEYYDFPPFEMRTSQMSWNYQGGPGKPQAAMARIGSQAIIYALTDPNVSSPIHEMAHVFQAFLTDAEKQEIISASGETEWNDAAQEYFATGFEKYLATEKGEGAMQYIFEKFKKWLTDIYHGITGSDIDVQLNEPMKKIYAQMLGGPQGNTEIINKPKIQEFIDAQRAKKVGDEQIYKALVQFGFNKNDLADFFDQHERQTIEGAEKSGDVSLSSAAKQLKEEGKSMRLQKSEQELLDEVANISTSDNVMVIEALADSEIDADVRKFIEDALLNKNNPVKLREALAKIAEAGTKIGRALRQFRYLKQNLPALFTEALDKKLKKAGRVMTEQQKTKLNDALEKQQQAKKEMDEAKELATNDPNQIENWKQKQQAFEKANDAVIDIMSALNVENGSLADLMSQFIQGNLLSFNSQGVNVTANLAKTVFGFGKNLVELVLGQTARLGGKKPNAKNKGWEYYKYGFKYGIPAAGKHIWQVLKSGHSSSDSLKSEIREKLRPWLALTSIVGLVQDKIKGLSNEDIANNRNFILTENKKGELVIPKKEVVSRAFRGIFGIFPELMFRLLAFGDKPFFEFSYFANAVVEGKRQGLSGKALENYVQLQADYSNKIAVNKAANFIYTNEDGAILNMTKFLKNKFVDSDNPLVTNMAPFLRLVTNLFMPYFKVPANILEETMTYMIPAVGVARAGMYANENRKLNAKLKTASPGKETEEIKAQMAQNTDKITDSIAKVIIGQILITSAYAIAQSGAMTGAPDKEDKKKRAAQFQYETPFNLNISLLKRYLAAKDKENFDTTWLPTDTQINYQSLGIFGTSLMFASMDKSEREQDLLKRAVNFNMFSSESPLAFAYEDFSRVASYALNQSFMSGMNTVVTSVADGDYENVITNLAKTSSAILIPNTLTTFDKALRDHQIERNNNYTGTDKISYDLGNIMREKLMINGIFGEQHPKLNNFGEPIPQTLEGENKFWSNVFDPLKISHPSPVNDWKRTVYNIGKAADDIGIALPPQPPPYLTDLDGKTYLLTRDEYDEYIKLVAAERQKLLKPNILTQAEKMLKKDMGTLQGQELGPQVAAKMLNGIYTAGEAMTFKWKNQMIKKMRDDLKRNPMTAEQLKSLEDKAIIGKPLDQFYENQEDAPLPE